MGKKRPKIYQDGETFEYKGRTLRVRIESDDHVSAPWKEDDGHGVVLDWQRTLSEDEAKAQGLWLLNSERGSARYYDARASLALAIKDCWGLGKSMSAKRRAVKRDFDYLYGWCNDQWSYVGIVGETVDGKENESLWGIESNAHEHIAETVQELAATLHARLPEVGAAEYSLTPVQRSTIVTGLKTVAREGNSDLTDYEIQQLCNYLQAEA